MLMEKQICDLLSFPFFLSSTYFSFPLESKKRRRRGELVISFPPFFLEEAKEETRSGGLDLFPLFYPPIAIFAIFVCEDRRAETSCLPPRLGSTNQKVRSAAPSSPFSPDIPVL